MTSVFDPVPVVQLGPSYSVPQILEEGRAAEYSTHRPGIGATRRDAGLRAASGRGKSSSCRLSSLWPSGTHLEHDIVVVRSASTNWSLERFILQISASRFIKTSYSHTTWRVTDLAVYMYLGKWNLQSRPIINLLKRLYHEEDNQLLIFCVFSRGRSSNILQKYKLENFLRIFQNNSNDSGKGSFGSISPIDVYMAINGFFLYSLEYSQKFLGWYFYEMFELPPHKHTQKIYKCLSSLW
jgi:hypothetical protein